LSPRAIGPAQRTVSHREAAMPCGCEWVPGPMVSRAAAGGDQDPVVPQLIGQEDVVPAGDGAHRHLHLADRGAEVLVLPVRVPFLVMVQALLEERPLAPRAPCRRRRAAGCASRPGSACGRRQRLQGREPLLLVAVSADQLSRASPARSGRPQEGQASRDEVTCGTMALTCTGRRRRRPTGCSRVAGPGQHTEPSNHGCSASQRSVAWPSPAPAAWPGTRRRGAERAPGADDHHMEARSASSRPSAAQRPTAGRRGTAPGRWGQLVAAGPSGPRAASHRRSAGTGRSRSTTTLRAVAGGSFSNRWRDPTSHRHRTSLHGYPPCASSTATSAGLR